MIVFESKPIVTTFNSIPIENISAFDKNSAYVQGAQRIYNNNVYEALTDIPKTVNHVWHNLDTSNTYGYDLYTDAKIPDPTNVYVENGITLVYVMSNKHYYRAKHTGYVDYTAENPVTPTNFDDLGLTPTPLYRTELSYPDGKKNTLFWEYKFVTNRNIIFDNVINRRSINNRTFTTTGTTTFNSSGVMTLSTALSSNIYVNDKIKISGTMSNDGIYKILNISVNRLVITIGIATISESVTNAITLYTQTYIKWVDFGVDKIAIFNTICDDIELKVTANGTPTIYSVDMKSDTSWINTFKLFCFNTPKNKLNHIFNIPANFNQEFEITFFGNTQEIGEVIQGQAIYLGKAEDSVTIDGKNYNPLVEADNGDIYLQDETSPITVLDGKKISLIYPSTQTSYYKDLIKTLTSKRLVISGDLGDKEDLPFLLSWCFIRNSNFAPVVNDELNKYNLEIRELL